MIKRLTEEQVLQRINHLWQQFGDRPEMVGVTFDSFKRECLEEFKKQNEMSDEMLKQYRETSYNDLIKEVDKLTTKDEKDKLNEQDSKTITSQDEMKFKDAL